MTEKEVEQALRRMVQDAGGYCLKWVCPGWSGVPDRVILLPGGRVIFCEVKRPAGGRISKLQLVWRERLQRLGFRHVFVHNRDDIKALKETIR